MCGDISQILKQAVENKPKTIIINIMVHICEQPLNFYPIKRMV